MPTEYIKKLSKEGKGSVASLESKWERAKKQASEEGKADNYAYITSIFQRMVGIEASPVKELSRSLQQVQAARRRIMNTRRY